MQNNPTTLYESQLSASSGTPELLRSIELSGFVDTEAVAWVTEVVTGTVLAIAEEDAAAISLCSVSASTTVLTRGDLLGAGRCAYPIFLDGLSGAMAHNKGIEGLAALPTGGVSSYSSPRCGTAGRALPSMLLERKEAEQRGSGVTRTWERMPVLLSITQHISVTDHLRPHRHADHLRSDRVAVGVAYHNGPYHHTDHLRSDHVAIGIAHHNGSNHVAVDVADHLRPHRLADHIRSHSITVGIADHLGSDRVAVGVANHFGSDGRHHRQCH